MLRRNKTFVKTKSLEFEDSYYDEDFEEIEEADDDRLIEGLSACSPQHSEASASTEKSGSTAKTDSLNNEHRNNGSGDFEFDEDYEDDEDFSRSFDLRSFHDALAEMNISRPKLYKNGTRSSLTFSNERVREIERHNQLLLKKIMQNGPADEMGAVAAAPKKKTKPKPQQPVVRSAAEVNRRKQQAKIDYENSILKRKLDKIAARRATLS